jgi:hypothetical protein
MDWKRAATTLLSAVGRLRADRPGVLATTRDCPRVGITRDGGLGPSGSTRGRGPVDAGRASGLPRRRDRRRGGESGARRLRELEGIDAGPETGAAVEALQLLLQQSVIRKSETTVIFNTGGNKYRS